MFVTLLFILFQVIQPRFVEQTTLKQSADTLISQNWTMDDGLPVNTVNSIVQDHLGYIWFTTYDGIVRFDGLEFKVYNHSNTKEMPQNRAVFMHVQEGVGIWVTLENGGAILIDENHQFTHFNEKDGFTSSNTTQMMEDSHGCMWFSTFEGLYKYNGTEFTRMITRTTPEQNRISFTYEDTDGTFWVATHDGLLHLNGKNVETYNIEAGTPQNEIFRIIRLTSGELLVGTFNGVYTVRDGKMQISKQFERLEGVPVFYFYNDQNVTLVSSSSGLYEYRNEKRKLMFRNKITDIQFFWKMVKDSNGVIWLINTRGDIFQYRDGNLINLEDADQIGDYYVNNYFEDRESNIWIATARSGILRYKASRVRTIGKPEGLSSNNILGLYEDSRGRFWVGTRDDGLNVIDGNKITQYREAEILNRDIVHAIHEDKKGNIWVGYYQGGVDRFNEAGIKPYDIGFGAGLNDVRAIYVSRDSAIWLGTHGGLVKFDPVDENHIVYTKEDGLSSDLIRYIDEDSEGGLWIATMSGGVNYFKDGNFTHFTKKDGLASDNIRSVYVDEREPETIWVGTENNGLSRIKNGKITSVGTDEGLPNHVIHYIKEDDRGWLWMSSNNGIFKVDKEQLNRFLDGERDFFNLVHFGQTEGMRNPEANGAFQQGGLLTSNNTFWFSTQEGVAIFQTEPQGTNEIPPTVIIERLVSSTGDVFSPDSISFRSGTEAFRIDFKALTFVSPEKTRYRYLLEGYDEDWHEVKNERSVLYADVPAGDYTFKVLAANSDGVWSQKGASVSFTISPVFYEQVWFYLLVAGLLFLGYYGATQLRYNYLMRQQEKLKNIIEEQTAQLRNEKNEIEEQSRIIKKQAGALEESNRTKDRFFSLIAHDLRNPFQAIMGYSEFLLQTINEVDKKEIEAGLQHIHSSSKSLLTLVEHLLDWASLNTGKIRPNPEEVDLRELIERSHQLFEHVARQKKIHLTYEIEDEGYIHADLNMLQTIVRNLVSNAIKFTPNSGEVRIGLSREDKNYVIKIEDNGIGMSEELVNKLLRLDSNTSRSGTNNEKGTGFGLLICKEMIELHHGRLKIDSEERVGTSFTIYLPVKGLKIPKKRTQKYAAD